MRERDLFIPKPFEEWEATSRGSGWWHVLARLRSDVTLAEAQAEMTAVALRMSIEHPRTNTDVGARVIPLHTRQVADIQTALLLSAGAVGFLLLIACVNVANLMLARCFRREQEFAVRAALGGGRGRLARQLLTESMVVAVLGGVGGVLFAMYALDVIVVLSPADTPRVDLITLNGRVLAFATLLVMTTAVTFGAAPVFQTWRRRVGAGLASGPRASASRGQRRLRAGLVTAEVALALILLVGAGLMVRSLDRLTNVDLGFDAERLAAFQIFAWEWEDTNPDRARFFRETLDTIRAVPGVEAAGAVSSLPLSLAELGFVAPLTLADRPPPPAGEEPTVFVSMATTDYRDTMRIPLVAGRWFAASDDFDSHGVGVVNETLARRYWPDREPLTERLSLVYQGDPIEIVGVVADMRPRGFDSAPRPELYLPQGQLGTGAMTLVVRTERDPAQMLTAVQEAVWSYAPLQTFYSVATLEQLLAESLASRRLVTVILIVFSAVALLLAGIGIYGVIAVSTAERTQEVGLRLALGADTRDIVGMVVRSAVGLAAGGVVLGLIAAFWLTRSLTSLLYEVAPTDATTLAAGAAVVLLVAAMAAYVPARRATRVDPLAALRAD